MHSLYILKGTTLGEMYEREEIQPLSLEEYIDRAVSFLEYLNPSIVVQRLMGVHQRKNPLLQLGNELVENT